LSVIDVAMSLAVAAYVTIAVPPEPAVTAMFAGQVIDGGVVSVTVIEDVQELEFPDVSVAV
jgi:hypothetical protein